MDESGFRNWLALQDVRPKLASDMVSRIKKVIRVTDFNLDEQYRIDGGRSVLSIFDQRGDNGSMDKFKDKTTLPVGRESLATYKLALRKYFSYLDLK